MKIAVIGAGAIGSIVAGYLTDKGNDVTLVARPQAVPSIQKNGIRISGARGIVITNIRTCAKLDSVPDLAILATKTQDIEAAIKDNLQFLKDTCILTTQNGVRADTLAARHLPKENIVSSIVMFGATSLNPGEIVHNFEGNWIIGRMYAANDGKVIELSKVLDAAFPVIISEDIKGMKYLKLFVNANNCIPAILGVSIQEAFADPEVSRISMAIWQEGVGVIEKAAIKLESLPDFPLDRLTKLLAMPMDDAAKIYSDIMKNLSKEPLYGSILQSIKRGKPSEIEYINGEFVALAKEAGSKAPLNAALVEMVHGVEKSGVFLPKAELIRKAGAFISK